eukprot:TRINITY_DN68635_c0_g1_i1.p1 TRINITY_DN68635_c0_g1~~TRINITY_DN68635_c0_g1_i1.p1  ORF type:complete len:206 (+),score=2.95 TRINITY_DN68635_c0_g1_i1:86-703(+)
MKYRVNKFRSLSLALRELKPFILNGIHLQNGKGFESMNEMRSREILANLLLCIAVNSVTSPDRLTFTSAPDEVGGDGVILDTVSGIGIPTEHVMVPAIPKNVGQDAGKLILEAVNHKFKKGGAAYAGGKTLVVFLFPGVGEWYPNKIARELPSPLLFDAVWVIALHSVDNGRYIYDVTRLDHPHPPIWRVKFNLDFDDWEVDPIQ